jgi:hypothetical protein
MLKAFAAGLLSGFGLAYLALHVKTADHSKWRPARSWRKEVTPQDKFVTQARKVLEENPEAATPNDEFLRDWAYGNAGLEDERITIEQVENVMRSGAKSA